jgi:hypothetical protein
MNRPPTGQVLFWVLSAAALASLGFFLALLAGVLPIEDPYSAPERTPAAVRAAPSTTAEETTAETERRPVVARRKASPQVATVVVTATRGDCWISARLGSENGRVLAERLLPKGESLTLTGARIWLSAGAAANVDLTVNGAARELQPGTVAVLLTPT